MGLLKDLYDDVVNGIIKDNSVIQEIVSQTQKEDATIGLYNPNSCPCDYGICNECKW